MTIETIAIETEEEAGEADGTTTEVEDPSKRTLLIDCQEEEEVIEMEDVVMVALDAVVEEKEEAPGMAVAVEVLPIEVIECRETDVEEMIMKIKNSCLWMTVVVVAEVVVEEEDEVAEVDRRAATSDLGTTKDTMMMKAMDTMMATEAATTTDTAIPHTVVEEEDEGMAVVSQEEDAEGVAEADVEIQASTRRQTEMPLQMLTAQQKAATMQPGTLLLWSKPLTVEAVEATDIPTVEEDVLVVVAGVVVVAHIQAELMW